MNPVIRAVIELYAAVVAALVISCAVTDGLARLAKSWRQASRIIQDAQGLAIEDMQDHPEAVRELPDPVERDAFWEIADAALKAGLAEAYEKTRRMQ